MQLKLHQKIRIKIAEWEKQGSLPVCGAELTYHPSSSFLQAVLDQPHIKNPSERRKELSQAEIEQIQKPITEYIEGLCSENRIRREIPRNHEEEMDEGRRNEEAMGKKYYEGLPNGEILRICSNGTRIALGILSMLEKDRNHFKDDPELRRHIHDQIRQELGAGFEQDAHNYRFGYTWHEVCNPLGIWEKYSWDHGFLPEESMFASSMSSDGLELIKARSVDCRMVFSDWKGRLLGYL